MNKITAIIPTLNEEIHIEEAIKSVSFADEIIVIDSYSTDKTIELAKKHNVKILQRVFDDFSSQKNYAIQQAKHNWIYILDADERISPELRKEILQTTKNHKNNIGFYVRRTFYFMGKKMNFTGFQRNKVMSLFHKDFCEYTGLVHETITAKGSVGYLKEKLNHYSYQNYHQYKNKLDHYAKLQAEELLKKGQIVTFFHLIIKPFIRWFLHYFVKLGIFDGYRGFVVSYLQGYGVYRRYVELLKLKYALNITTNKNSELKIINKRKAIVSTIDVSIITVNYKSWKHLKNCLQSLKKIQKKQFSFEVIVVDNFSDDGKIKEFSKEFSETIFIENTGNNGFANGCNVGAKNSIGKYLLFLNPDTITSEDAIYKMLQTAQENTNFGIVSCSQMNSNGKPEDAIRLFPSLITLFGILRAFYRKMGSNYKKLSESKDNIIFPNWVSGSTVFISKKWFQKINGWDEDYWMYYEDVDLSKKVTDLGGKVALQKDAKIIHDHGGASRFNTKTASLTKTEVLISRHIYISKHFSGIKKIISQVLIVFQTLISKIILGVIGFVFCYIPKLNVQWYLLVNIVRYYFIAIKNKTWLSSRSVKFNR